MTPGRGAARGQLLDHVRTPFSIVWFEYARPARYVPSAPQSVVAFIVRAQKITLIRRFTNSSSEKIVSVNGRKGAAPMSASRVTSFSPNGAMRIS